MTHSELIQKYPKIFQQYEGNPGMVNWLDLPEGWIGIIDILCGSIQNYVDNYVRYTKDGEYRPTQVTCSQMKEKFGGLLFYTNGNDDYVEGMISMAEHMAYRTCQDCSSQEDVGMIKKSWLTTICRKCCMQHGDRAMENWEPNK